MKLIPALTLALGLGRALVHSQGPQPPPACIPPPPPGYYGDYGAPDRYLRPWTAVATHVRITTHAVGIANRDASPDLKGV